MENNSTTHQTNNEQSTPPSHSSGGVFTPKQRAIESCKQTLSAWCDCNFVDFNWLTGKRRAEKHCKVRKEAYAFLRECKFSYPVIGAVFNRDHSSVIHLFKRQK